jgi:hypothetical protein
MPTTKADKASAQASTYSTAGSGWHVRSARALETRSPRTSIRTHGHGVGQPGGWNGSLSPRFIESDRTIDDGTLDGTSPTRRRLVSVAPSGGRQPRSRAERLGDVEQSPFPTLPPLPPPTAAAQLRRRQPDASPPHDLNVDLWVDSARRRDARTRIETAKAITRARGGSARTPPRTAPRGLEPSKPPSSRHPTQNHPTQLVPPETVPITTTQCDESIPGGASG